MIKERPILFSGPMVRAILEGRKTQTRRVMSNQPAGQSIGLVYVRQVGDGFQWYGEAGESSVFPCPYGKPGDRLWVRETWSGRGDMRPFYRADNEPYLPYGGKWKPSTHMPRWASRITLEVESVRVERLQDISEEDAWAEGAGWETTGDTSHSLDALARMTGRTDPESNTSTRRAHYALLWEKINGPGSWNANPWVWVVTFKRIAP